MSFKTRMKYDSDMNEKTPTPLYSWALQKATSPKAPLWIGLLFALELFLFIPLDAILMFFCLQNRSRIFLYASIATIASLVSGLIGYFLGHFLWDLISSYVVPHLISNAAFERISSQFQNYENWAVFFGALVPFPLKALSLGAGVFHLGFLPFALCFAAARTLRFLLIGGMMAIWGEKVKLFVERHFSRIIMAACAKIAMVFLFFWVFAK
jgi:membrane protein YqaA with SNARE-associated domain